MSPLQLKMTRYREHQIRLAEVALCQAVGNPVLSEQCRMRLVALATERSKAIQKAEEEEGACYFDKAGEIARIRSEARSATE